MWILKVTDTRWRTKKPVRSKSGKKKVGKRRSWEPVTLTQRSRCQFVTDSQYGPAFCASPCIITIEHSLHFISFLFVQEKFCGKTITSKNSFWNIKIGIMIWDRSHWWSTLVNHKHHRQRTSKENPRGLGRRYSPWLMLDLYFISSNVKKQPPKFKCRQRPNSNTIPNATCRAILLKAEI